MDKKIKLYVLTGFLGSGKTTFLLNMLDKHRDRKIGIIQNEFGKLSIDVDIIRSGDIEMRDLTRGSIFCSCLKLKFVEALAEMSEMGLDCLFVESSGLADPSNLFEILEALAVLKPDRPYELAGTICLVDAVSFLDDASELEAVVRQIIHCNIALVNKCDLADREKIDGITKQIRSLNGNCLIIETSNGVMDEKLLSIDLSDYEWAECEASTNTADTKPKTFSIEFDGVPKEKMTAFLEAVAPECYRIKGFGVLDGNWQQIDVVTDRIDYKDCADRSSGRLVFISRVGIQLIRDIKNMWDELVSLPVKLNN